jgi:colanic acid biosynthesis glycosyl transferase WcaI
VHILLVTTYFEPDSGAAAVRLSRLARLLQRRGHQVMVLTALPHYPRGRIDEGYRGRFSLVEERDGLRVVRAWLYATPSPRISRKLISQVSFMLAAALRGVSLPRPDVILIEAQPVFTGLAGVFLREIKRAPYVLNVSDLWPDHLLSVGALTERHLIYRAARRVVDGMYRGAAGIVALSPAWAESIRRTARLPEDDPRLQVIYNGVDLARFRPGLDTAGFREKYGLDATRIVSFIGTFATQYDFEAFFALTRRFEARADVRFVLIGGGSQAETIARHRRPNVEHIGWIPHNEIPLAWAASRLTCWAMRDEALYRGTIPAKLYEALACGVPVAAAMAGEGANMIAASGGGIAVAPGDLDGLEQAVTRLLDDDDYHGQCSQSGRRYAEAHFNPEGVAAAYEDVLLRAAGKISQHGQQVG